MSRWGVYVHDGDGDMGEGEIVGPFKTSARAEEYAARVRRQISMYSSVEAIVIPVSPGGTSARAVIERVRA